MSAPRLPLSLTKRAQRDLYAIHLYSLRTWGPEQAASYAARIDRALEHIQANPKLGRTRDEIRAGLLSFPVERHVVLYRVTARRIEVVRILHERIDAERELGNRRKDQD